MARAIEGVPIQPKRIINRVRIFMVCTPLRMPIPSTEPTIEPMLLGLDAGEMDVLLLAREIAPDWVLIDERQGRRIAQAMNLPVKGTLGILLAAVLAGLMSKEEALNGMQQLVTRGIRISPQWQTWLEKELEKD